MSSPVARVFLSSTFRDFGEERDLLVRRVFPALRVRLRERFIELVDVDLRWGITVEQAERGEVLPICLAEIDRARPWFVCMLGDRYGWMPEVDAYDARLLEERPWLNEHRGGKSVTELEILHGVLNDPAMAGRALFYFRDPAYACQKGGDYASASSDDAVKLEDLKDRIRASGFPVVEGYPTPEALADRLEADLWAVLDEAFPAEDVPDPFTREQRKHEAYAAPRRRLYFGGDAYKAALTAAFDNGAQRVLITGQSGGGKSALIANWLEGYKAAHPADRVHSFYLGASGDASSPVNVVRHLIEHIKRAVSSDEDVAGDPQAMFDSLPTWLAYASAHAEKENYRWIVALDGLNGLSNLRDLRWWPEFLPERVHIAVSCLPSAVFEALKTKGEWQEVVVEPLNTASARNLLRAYLARYNKTLADDLEARALAHPMAINPLFLRTLAEELRLFGSHEELSDRLDHYLQSITVDDLFERVLERVEKDCGRWRVETVMAAIWASRAGLTEQEILAYAKLVPATWAPIRFALENALLESGGRITFAHDYMRIAVSDRYMAGNNTLEDDGQSSKALTLRRKEHEKLAKWFEQLPADERVVEEVPHQWRQAKAWEKLKACLTQRAMFEAICEHCLDEELLGYWLDLERETGADILACYEVAWTAWEADETVIGTGDLAGYLEAFLSFSGRYSQFGIMLAKLSLELNEKFKGADHASTGTSLNNLAMLFDDMGDYASAEPLSRRALTIAEKAHGPEHPSVSERLNNLALLLMDMGDHTAAGPLIRRALAISEKAQGPDHSDTGHRLNTMAGLLHDMGDFASAEPLCRRALAISEKAQGPDHSDTGNRLQNLAGLLRDMGEYTAAEPIYRRALAIAEKVLGPDHTDTGASLSNLALLLKKMGDYASAEPLYRRALAIAEKAQGPEHPSTGTCLNNLALLLQAMGDYASAVPLYRRALTVTERNEGAESASLGERVEHLADLLFDIDDFEGAAPLYRQALGIFEGIFGPEHNCLCDILHSLGCALDELGHFYEAEPLLRREISITEDKEGLNTHTVAMSRCNLGLRLLNAGQIDDAQQELLKSLKIAEQISDESSPFIANALMGLGLACALREDKNQARSYYSRSLKILHVQSEPNQDDICEVEQRIADLERD
jgi:tetratricopeptide (TPR) repeat protein